MALEILKIELITDKEKELIGYLSDRQYEIFECLSKGMTPGEISRIPGKICSVKTIETHVFHLKEKLKTPNIHKLRHLATRFFIYLDNKKLSRVVTPPPKT